MWISFLNWQSFTQWEQWTWAAGTSHIVVSSLQCCCWCRWFGGSTSPASCLLPTAGGQGPGASPCRLGVRTRLLKHIHTEGSEEKSEQSQYKNEVEYAWLWQFVFPPSFLVAVLVRVFIARLLPVLEPCPNSGGELERLLILLFAFKSQGQSYLYKKP